MEAMTTLNSSQLADEILLNMQEGITNREDAIKGLVAGINSYLNREVMYFGKSVINGMSHKYKVFINIDPNNIFAKTLYEEGDDAKKALGKLGKAIEEEINKTELLTLDLNSLGILTETNYMNSNINLGLSSAKTRGEAIGKLAEDICKGIYALPLNRESSVFIESASAQNKPQKDTCLFTIREG